jgi:hypothetical protein
VADEDPIAEHKCPSCGATLSYLGHLDCGIGSGPTRFNVLLWDCGDCGGRYSAKTDLTDPHAVSRVVPEPWPIDTYWPG